MSRLSNFSFHTDRSLVSLSAGLSFPIALLRPEQTDTLLPRYTPAASGFAQPHASFTA
jgi:hypothetical protein